MIDPGNTNAYQKFVEPSTVEEYASYWKVYLEHTCLGEFVGYDGAEEEDDHGDDHDEHEDGEGEKKWVGDLPYNIYGPGGCSDENIVGNGKTTELVATEDGGVCETDIIQGATIFTKFDSVCGDDENPDKIFVTFYDCDSSTCTNCSETPELLAYGSMEDFDAKSLTTNVDHCFGWTTTGGDTNQTAMSQMASTEEGEKGYQKFIPPSTLDDTSGYWKVYLLNSCAGDFLGYDVLGDEIEDTEEDGHDHDDHGEHDGQEDTSNNIDSEAFNVSSVKLSAAIMFVLYLSGFMF